MQERSPNPVGGGCGHYCELDAHWEASDIHAEPKQNENDSQARNAPYDWRCEIHGQGGGFQEVNDEHHLLAPSDGYAQSFLIDMPKTLARKLWNSRAKKSYWLHFPDNTYGKISFMMIARGDHFAGSRGYRNPFINDRNFEHKLDDK